MLGLKKSNFEDILLTMANKYGDHLAPMSAGFIFGFLLGDGYAGIKFRTTDSMFQFSPLIVFSQKPITENRYLIDLIIKFLRSLNIPAYFQESSTKNGTGNSYIRIEGKIAVRSFMDSCVFAILNSYLFCSDSLNPINHTLKSSQFRILNKLFQYFDSGLNKFVLEARIFMIKYIYSFENTRAHSSLYWIKKATDIFNKNVQAKYQSGYTFISLDLANQAFQISQIFRINTG